MSKCSSINKKIRQLNHDGNYPIIFVITGGNLHGKTTLSRELIRQYDFHQTINLGIISKMIRFFHPNQNHDAFENFGTHNNIIFENLISFIIDHYYNMGTNIIIEGVQINTLKMSKDKSVLGGVILEMEKSVLSKREKHSKTHFFRKSNVTNLRHIDYIDTENYINVNNDKLLAETMSEVSAHLDLLLSRKMKHL